MRRFLIVLLIVGSFRSFAFDTDTITRGRGLNNTGAAHHRLGNFTEAEKLYLRAIALLQDPAAREHLAATLTNLTDVYRAQLRLEEAAASALRALEIRRDLFGETHPSFANTLNAYATVLTEHGKLDQAESMGLRALSIRESLNAAPDSQYAAILQNLARIYREQTKHSQAEKFYLRSLDVRESAGMASEPEAAVAWNNLGALYEDQGRLDDARTAYERALKIRLPATPDHPAVASVFNNLSVLAFKQGDFDQSESLAAKAVDIFTKSLGATHKHTGLALLNLARTQFTRRDLVKAEPSVRQAISIFERDESLEVFLAQALEDLASIFIVQNKYSGAEKLLNRSIALKSLRSPGDERIAHLRQSLANLMLLQGRMVEANRLRR